MTVDVGYMSADDNDFTIGSVSFMDVEFDVTWIDYSFMWNLLPDRRSVITLYAGPGWAWTEASGTFTGPISGWFEDIDDSTLTFHAGFGSKIRITESSYLRIASRFRYFDERKDDEIDSEFTLGWGWSF